VRESASKRQKISEGESREEGGKPFSYAEKGKVLDLCKLVKPKQKHMNSQSHPPCLLVSGLPRAVVSSAKLFP